MGAKTLSEVYDYALSLYGTPYQWGGGHDNSSSRYGLDCSGFVRKLIEFIGISPKGDNTADDYYHYFLGNGTLNGMGLGALAFFGTTTKIHHVGFSLDSKILISAAGGGSHVNTLTVAKRLNAFVKIEPIHLRLDFVCCIMPNYQIGV